MLKFALKRITFIKSRAFHPKRWASSIFEVVAGNELADIDISCIRNFSVIAHVDHGKSTLSDGITVKAQTASMIYEDERNGGKRYLINLIDTPGHIDFSYEVARSLASCQGALLLVDSTQSVQAQTLANHAKAKTLGLQIIPVVTKIDLPNSQVEETAIAMGTTFGVDPDTVIPTSAKMSIGVLDVLHAVVDRLPSPAAAMMKTDGPFLGRIVDSWFDEHRGVVCLIQVVGGQLKENERITTFASIKESKDIDSRSDFGVQEIGILTPKSLRTTSLRTGQVGYVIAGMRSTRQARIGDTMYIPTDWISYPKDIIPLSGYETAKQMLFASVFPVDTLDLENLFAAVDRLCLNDSSISVSRDQSSSLGSGLRCGFLGFLHMEVFTQRLQDEFNVQIIMTSPSVPYRIEYPDGNVLVISNVGMWPEPGTMQKGTQLKEPMVKVVLITPEAYYGAMMDIVKDRRGTDIITQFLDDGQVLMTTIMPWQEVVCDMNDAVKHASSGYATFNYEESDYRVADLIKVIICVNGDPCDPLSFVSHSSKAVAAGKKLVTKLKDVLDRQQFEINLQAKIGTKIVASEKLKAYRKDVLARSGKTVGGGDITRKKKLLEKQKDGKKRAKLIGKVEISQEAFFSVLSR